MLNEFIRYLVAERRYSPLTVRNYERDLKRFLTWRTTHSTSECHTDEPLMENFHPELITADEIREWIIYRTSQEHISPQSMNRELSSLRTFFRWAHAKGIVKKDVTLQISSLRTARRLPSFVPETRMTPLVEECMAEESDFEKMRNQLIILMFYTCGLRLQELIAINREDFTENYTTLKVAGKGDKQRLIPIMEVVKEKILQYLGIIDGENICFSKEKALFLTHEGKRISRSTVYRIVQRTLGVAGVDRKSVV